MPRLMLNHAISRAMTFEGSDGNTIETSFIPHISQYRDQKNIGTENNGDELAAQQFKERV